MNMHSNTDMSCVYIYVLYLYLSTYLSMEKKITTSLQPHCNHGEQGIVSQNSQISQVSQLL